jgi:hypothetical protein
MVLITEQPNQARERLALDVVHHQEDTEGIGVHFGDGDDVGMSNARRQAGFFEQMQPRLFVRAQVRMHQLQRDFAFKACNPAGSSEIDGRRAASSQRK